MLVLGMLLNVICHTEKHTLIVIFSSDVSEGNSVSVSVLDTRLCFHWITGGKERLV